MSHTHENILKISLIAEKRRRKINGNMYKKHIELICLVRGKTRTNTLFKKLSLHCLNINN